MKVLLKYGAQVDLLVRCDVMTEMDPGLRHFAWVWATGSIVDAE